MVQEQPDSGQTCCLSQQNEFKPRQAGRWGRHTRNSKGSARMIVFYWKWFKCCWNTGHVAYSSWCIQFILHTNLRLCFQWWLVFTTA